MEDTFLEFNQVTVQYDVQAEPTLYDINLSIKRGETVLLAGASGSGKTTLARLLNGLIPHEFPGQISGSIKLAGKELLPQGIFERSLKIGTVLQDTNAQFVGLTTVEDVAFALENDALPHAEMVAKVMTWAEELNLLDLLDLAPQVLSGGQKQRVAIAGVLIDDAPILLFDEPLASLDPASGQRMMELLQRLQTIRDLTVIIVEHRIEDVLQAAVDRVVILADGRIVADDAVQNVLRQNILSKHGLATPAYIRLLSQAGVDLTTVDQLADPRQLTGPAIATKLQAINPSIATASDHNLEQAQLEIEHLNFKYGNKPLFNDLSVTINKGEIVALVGKNGSGKSTLSQLIVGFLTPQAGQLTFGDNLDLLALSIKERADYVGYVTQNPHQMLTQSIVFDEVAIGLRLRGEDEETIRPKVEQLLKMAGLYGMRNWPISVLSYGQKKRLTMLAVLILEPQILILDEPTAGQDLAHAQEIMHFVTDLNARLGTTILLVTHDMALMQTIAQRVLVLTDGELIADTTPNQLLTDDDIVSRADLKTTSIAILAARYGIADAAGLLSWLAIQEGLTNE
ncbi:MAG: ABC transporter ATP-binding protein [Lactobacillaceae bacterium]|jgi:energy-coupling factor transport system ATP-binding protein|nr:ABC transporter ATP-binding protein [Lactobacillaceae bacterium]